MQKQVTFRLENKMFYFPSIAQFPKNAVEYRAFAESIPTNSPQMLNVIFRDRTSWKNLRSVFKIFIISSKCDMKNSYKYSTIY